MNWKVLEHSRNQVIVAGKKIRDKNTTPEERKEALKIVDNWRAAHAYPLNIIYNNVKKKSRNYPKAIVAQRLKRLVSIEDKLKREATMNLWEMQDLGGCRVIVESIDEVYKFADEIKNSKIKHKYKKANDYIRYPRKTGYRSYHLVYQYFSDKKQTYNQKMLIEIQIRTRLQHLWATAVETMGIVTKQALKASQGDETILHYLSLVSELFAHREKSISQSFHIEYNFDPMSVLTLINEILELEKHHKYREMLKGIKAAGVQIDQDDIKSDGYYLLVFDYTSRQLEISYYDKEYLHIATDAYNSLENSNIGSEKDIVLVSVDSFDQLRKAFPNYFTAIDDFCDELIGSMKLMTERVAEDIEQIKNKLRKHQAQKAAEG